MTSSVVDYKNLVTTSFYDANISIVSGVRSRWERKKMQAASSGSFENDSSTDIRQPLGYNNRQH